MQEKHSSALEYAYLSLKAMKHKQPCNQLSTKIFLRSRPAVVSKMCIHAANKLYFSKTLPKHFWSLAQKGESKKPHLLRLLQKENLPREIKPALMRSFTILRKHPCIGQRQCLYMTPRASYVESSCSKARTPQKTYNFPFSGCTHLRAQEVLY